MYCTALTLRCTLKSGFFSEVPKSLKAPTLYKFSTDLNGISMNPSSARNILISSLLGLK